MHKRYTGRRFQKGSRRWETRSSLSSGKKCSRKKQPVKIFFLAFPVRKVIMTGWKKPIPADGVVSIFASRLKVAADGKDSPGKKR